MYRLVAIAIALSVVLTAADNDPSRSAASTVLAEIDGVRITLADFEAKRPAGLFQARNNFFEAEHKAIEEFVSDYLLIREAQKEGVTVPVLLERHASVQFRPADDIRGSLGMSGGAAPPPQRGAAVSTRPAFRTS